jgi:hypothetical protein
MKNLFLVGIAALLLATGTAHADEIIFECHGVIVTEQHLSDAQVYNVEIGAPRHTKQIPPVVVFDVANQKLKVNGKSCKKKSEE